MPAGHHGAVLGLRLQHWTFGSPRLERYNGQAAVEIQGAPAPGKSSGDAMDEMEKLVAQLPPGVRHEWTGLSHQEKLSGNQAPALYAISACCRVPVPGRPL
jgi:multidrug efflux pump